MSNRYWDRGTYQTAWQDDVPTRVEIDRYRVELNTNSYTGNGYEYDKFDIIVYNDGSKYDLYSLPANVYAYNP